MANVLIIDDDSALRGTMKKILKRAGHEVVEAEDGARGLELFRYGAFDLVITDLIMPEKEGIETILELRADHPEVRILAVSGGLSVDEDGGVLQDAEALGADDSLAKPFSVEELMEKVEPLL